MNIHHQAPHEVIDIETPLHSYDGKANSITAEREHVPVAIKYSTFHLPARIPTNGEDVPTANQHLEATIQATATAYEQAEAAFEESKSFYHVDPHEWTAAEAQWRAWASKQDVGLEAGRFHVSPHARAPWRQREVEGAVAEARFSRVLEPVHGDACVVCEAVRITEGNTALGGEEKLHRLARLEHKMPRLQLVSSAGVFSPLEPSPLSRELADELNASTWGYEQTSPIQQKPTPSMVETLANSLPNPDIHDLHPKPSTALSNQRTLVSTAQLLQSTDDTALLDAMMLDPSLLLRTRVCRQNEQTVEKAIALLAPLKGLSAVDRKAVARTTAEVWELKRELLRLESVQQALGTRVEWAGKGYSVNGYNSRVAGMRRGDYGDVGSRLLKCGRLGAARGLSLDRGDEEEGLEGEEKEGKCVTEKKSDTEMDDTSQLEEQSSLKIPAQPEAAKLNTEQNRSPSPLSPAVSSEQHEQTFPEEPAQSTHGPSMFLNTLHNFHMHNLSATQDDSRPPFTEDKPSKHDTQRQPLTLSTIGEAALPGHATPAKGKAKKDSKVEEMMSEDGASLKEFAAKSNEQTSPRPRELPFKAGSARPRWR